MRKIFAYVVMTVTLLATMIFFIPNIKENSHFAMEYTGGFEVLYKTKSNTKDVSDKQIANTISDGMNKILDINNIDETIITVEDGNFIRANVTSENQLVSDQIRNLIQNRESYEITFRDAEDNLLAKGEEILKEVGASYEGELNYYGYPIIYLNIADTDKLYEITSQVVNATDKHLVIWVGFEEGVDSYANITSDSSTAKKVIYNATVNEALDDELITITGEYTEEEAKNTVNLVNSGTYSYNLEVVQVKSVKEADALKNRNLVLIGLGVSIIIAIAAMCVFFKTQGAYAAISVLVSEFVTIFAFNKIVGVVNPQVVGAFILFNVILFALIFILLNKYTTTLKTNKSPIKAYKDTYKKNGMIILDSSVTLLLFSIVTYFLGNNAENFAILLSTASVSIFLSLFILERFVMYLTCDFLNKNDRSVIVSNNSDKVESKEVTITNIDNYTKHSAIGFLGLIGLGGIVILLTALIFKSPFTFYGNANNGSTIEIITDEKHFTTEEDVMKFFDKEDMSFELSSIKFEENDNKYHVYITTEESVSKYEKILKEDLIELCGENTRYEENYILYVNDYNNESLLITFKSTLYTSGISLIVIAIYFALRYKYSYSLATVTSTIMTVASILAFFGLTRIPVNNESIIAISIIAAYSLITLVPFFTRIKEYMIETRKVYLSYEDRVNCFKKGRDAIVVPTLVTTALIIVISLVTMFFDLANFSFYLAIILGSMFALVYNMIIVPRVWLLFENKSDKHKKTFKNKNISKSKYRTIDEQVFIGVND